VARAAVADRSQLIELCGVFGTEWSARVIDAIDHAIPVGNVGYPLAQLNSLRDLLWENFPD
jgi:hypothetical protein